MKLSQRKFFHRHHAEEGFTLIELLIAMSVLAFGILAIASMQASSLLGTQNAYRVTEGTTWAEETIEDLMALNYGHADLNPSTNPHQVTQGDYTVTWNVTEGSPISDTKTVDVDVTYTIPGGAQKVSSLQFIVVALI